MTRWLKIDPDRDPPFVEIEKERTKADEVWDQIVAAGASLPRDEFDDWFDEAERFEVLMEAGSPTTPEFDAIIEAASEP